MIETQPRTCTLCLGTGRAGRLDRANVSPAWCPACDGNGWRWVTVAVPTPMGRLKIR